MTGRILKDGHGILEPARTVAALNAAGIPTVPFDDTELYVASTSGVPTVGDRIDYVTLSASPDWAELGGSEDDLAEVYDAFVAAMTAAGVPFIRYWGPNHDTTMRNVLIVNGYAVTLSLGWPES